MLGPMEMVPDYQQSPPCNNNKKSYFQITKSKVCLERWVGYLKLEVAEVWSILIDWLIPRHISFVNDRDDVKWLKTFFCTYCNIFIIEQFWSSDFCDVFSKEYE